MLKLNDVNINVDDASPLTCSTCTRIFLWFTETFSLQAKLVASFPRVIISSSYLKVLQ